MEIMNVEGVNFVDDAVRKMKKKDFIEMHKAVFFLDRSESERENMLSDIHDRITGQKKQDNKTDY